MKKLIFILTFLALLLPCSELLAQCSLCTKTAQQLGEAGFEIVLDEEDAARRGLVIERLCLAAAWALRERPDEIWPPASDGTGRVQRPRKTM